MYNSNLNERIDVVKFKVNTPHVQVLNSEGKVLENIQISLLWQNVEGVNPVNFGERKMSNTKDLHFAYDYDSKSCELLFEVNVPGLSLTSFTIKKLYQEGLSNISPDVTFYHSYSDEESINDSKQNILEK